MMVNKNIINFAHRGASEYTPENTMLAFNVGIFMGADGVETDVQLTKDGVAVLFHDDTLMRVTGEKGAIADYTYEELRKFYVSKNDFCDKIVKLEDFLKSFHFRDIIFAIELKERNSAEIVCDLIKKYDVAQKTVVTSFQYDALVAVRAYAPDINTGYLTAVVTEELLERMKQDGIYQLCPEAQILKPELVLKWHGMGFNVRAWGVYDEELMIHSCNCGVDGMTVNFPDKLYKYIRDMQNNLNL